MNDPATISVPASIAELWANANGPDELAQLRAQLARECVCSLRWTPATGCYDPVTCEWAENRPTVHVRLIPHPDCRWHR